MQKLIAFTGGGTAGHVLPAAAVIERLTEDPQVTVAWIGSRRGIERLLVSRWAIPYHWVPCGKLRRYFSVRNLSDAVAVVAGFLASLFLLARLKPSLLFSKGGYVSVPPVVAAWILRIPVVSHESDLRPGLATRINARFSHRILVAYPETAAMLRSRYGARVLQTGNPVRAAVAAGNRERGLHYLGFNGRRPVVLFLGGSQGSQQINELVTALLPQLRHCCDIVHQRGSHAAAAPDGAGYRSEDFVTEAYPDLLAAADLVVCRAGAGTLWELSSIGKPALLLPLGRDASRGDQIENARYFSERGAAVTLETPTAEQLSAEITALLRDTPRAARMGAAARAIVGGDPVGAVTEVITSLGETRRARPLSRQQG